MLVDKWTPFVAGNSFLQFGRSFRVENQYNFLDFAVLFDSLVVVWFDVMVVEGTKCGTNKLVVVFGITSHENKFESVAEDLDEFLGELV